MFTSRMMLFYRSEPECCIWEYGADFIKSSSLVSHTLLGLCHFFYNLLSTVVSFIVGLILFGVHLQSFQKLFWSLLFLLQPQPGSTPVEPTFLNMCGCSHRNIRLLGDGLIAFPFNAFIVYFHSDPLYT